MDAYDNQVGCTSTHAGSVSMMLPGADVVTPVCDTPDGAVKIEYTPRVAGMAPGRPGGWEEAAAGEGKMGQTFSLVPSSRHVAGRPYMNIQYAGVDILNSPHQLTVSSSTAVVAARCTAEWPELPGEATKETSFYVTLRDADGNMVGAEGQLGERANAV